MARSKKAHGRHISSDRRRITAGSGGGNAALGGRLKRSLICWYESKNPVLVFALLFALVLAAFYALTLAPLFKATLFPAYLRWNAAVSGAALRVLGQGTSVSGTTLSSPRFSVDIRRGCDAVEPTALFVAAVLAFPARWKGKFVGLVAGAAVLAVLNLVRITSLLLCGVYFPRAFDAVHAEVWQALFILLAVVLWLLWIQWAMKPRPAVSDVPA